MDEKAFVEGVTVLANASGLTSLCHHLARKGAITTEEFELIRHDHLRQFDRMLQLPSLSQSARQMLEERREFLDVFWQFPSDEEMPDV